MHGRTCYLEVLNLVDLYPNLRIRAVLNLVGTVRAVVLYGSVRSSLRVVLNLRSAEVSVQAVLLEK